MNNAEKFFKLAESIELRNEDLAATLDVTTRTLFLWKQKGDVPVPVRLAVEHLRNVKNGKVLPPVRWA